MIVCGDDVIEGLAVKGLERFDGSSVWEGFECILRYLKDLKFGIIHIGGDPTEGKQREEEGMRIVMRNEGETIRGREVKRVLVNRLRNLASTFLKVLEKKGREHWRKGFKANPKEYDIVFKLSPSVVTPGFSSFNDLSPSSSSSSSPPPIFKGSKKYKNLTVTLPPNFDCVSTLTSRLALHSDYFLTFHNPLTPEVLGIIFTPEVKTGIFDPKYSRFMEIKQDGKVGINIQQVIDEVKEMGKGIIVESKSYIN
ncbi:hypothetical protein TrVE_jg481 [Triparma verrucosa]|uniref:Nrap protein domain-containing protein n=1 Tax=Triparma verrucosa TaxID=1606542 RepID=A0A9W7EX06_9STRA|nr:hypothetical protein TrVE_jg481 [Triparma verrucosa]